ncbi:MAG: PsbP-related protein [bacterium]
MKNRQNGFGTIEALLVLVVVGILGFTGWYVYNANHKSSANLTPNKSTVTVVKKKNSSTSTTSLYAGWKSYSSGNISIKYPSDWTAKSPGALGQIPSLVNLSSPSKPSGTMPPYYAAPGAVTGIQWQINLLDNDDQGSLGCQADNKCTVNAVQALAIKGVDAPKLVTLTNGSNSSELDLISGNVKTGDTKLTQGFIVNGKRFWIFAQPVYATSNGVSGEESAAVIKNISAFKESPDYKQLVNIFNSIMVN